MTTAGLIRKPLKIATKLWGREVWLVNNEEYCGKILEFEAGGLLSLHFHRNKMETWYVVEGYGLIEMASTLYEPPENVRSETWELKTGDVVDIDPFTLHRYYAITHTRIFETSTMDIDDNVRVEPSRAAGWRLS